MEERKEPAIYKAFLALGWIAIAIGVLAIGSDLNNSAAISVTKMQWVMDFAVVFSGLMFLWFGAVIGGLHRIEMAIIGEEQPEPSAPSKPSDPRTEALIKLLKP